jgi:hypothetical protein
MTLNEMIEKLTGIRERYPECSELPVEGVLSSSYDLVGHYEKVHVFSDNGSRNGISARIVLSGRKVRGSEDTTPAPSYGSTLGVYRRSDKINHGNL